MKQQKLNYRFHNPNPPDVMAEFLFRLFIEVNKGKVERALRAAAEEMDKEEQVLLQSAQPEAEAPQKESVCKKLKDLSSSSVPSTPTPNVQDISR